MMGSLEFAVNNVRAKDDGSLEFAMNKVRAKDDGSLEFAVNKVCAVIYLFFKYKQLGNTISFG